jgi:probable F420-dependent oxidoreductase
MRIEPGRIGLWSGALRRGDRDRARDAIPELESLGYGTIWMPGGAGPEFFGLAEEFLAASHRIVMASGILSVWSNPAADVAAGYVSLEDRYPGRFLLGLGVSHADSVERLTGRHYEHPLAVMNHYLDELAASSSPPPREALVLAALGPRMLALSRDRSSGAHPYLVTPMHTRIARFVLGDAPLLAPEQAVVLERDPSRARAIGRRHLARYLGAPNYTNNWRRLGFVDRDFVEGGSDRLVDAMVAWGDLDAVRARVEEHFAAGANHVCLQVLTEEPDSLPLAEWRALAALVAS